ncbi:hypothetical protein DH2020_002102 [Rehmannia glutinosa]|uniref:FAR1 domain-containing protein n=1 Tax=Rehmannia glutinosa TaxID=99300 RepID=A0ABR0XSR3_REHGL
MAYYDAHAKSVGFVIRICNFHRSSLDGSLISRRILCNKEGFHVDKKAKRLEVRKLRAVTREGCKAMIMVRKEKSGTWHGSGPARSQDEKDKRVCELSVKLHRTKQRLSKCERLGAMLNDVQLHVDHPTAKTSKEHNLYSKLNILFERISHDTIKWSVPS